MKQNDNGVAHDDLDAREDRHEQKIRTPTNLRYEAPPQYLNQSKMLLNASENSIGLIFVMLVIICALLAIGYYFVFADSCIEDYQRLECWR